MRKYFIPNEENEYKPHIMRRAAVGMLSFIAILIFFAGVIHTAIIKKTNFLSAVIPQSLVELANADRAGSQLAMLTINPTLQEAAQAKANDMATNGYFAHNSPLDSNKTPWYWFGQAGYRYQYAGENLAVNFSDSVDVNTAWMNSPGHRANILNDKFTEVGIATARGVYKGYDTVFVVQMFGKPLPEKTTPVAAVIATQKPAQSTSTKPTTTPSTVVSAPQKVLSETDTFVAVENTDDTDNTVVTQPASPDVRKSLLTELITSPKKLTSTLLMILGVFIFLSLILMILVEFKRQHPKNIILGIGLLILIVSLIYIYKNFIFTEVIVA